MQFLVSSGVAKPEGEKSGRGKEDPPPPPSSPTDDGELSRLSVAGVLEFLVKAGRSPHGARRDAELWPGDNTLASHATEVGSYSPQRSRIPPLADCKNRQTRATDIRAVGFQRNN